MKINNREVGFLWSVGAFCDYNDFLVANPETSIARANMKKAVLMSQAYCDANGGEPLTEKELASQPVYIIDELFPAIKKAEEEGSVRTVETQEKKDQAKGKTQK